MYKFVLFVMTFALICSCTYQGTGEKNLTQELTIIKIAAKDGVYFGGKGRIDKEKLDKIAIILEKDILPILKNGKIVITGELAGKLFAKLDTDSKLLAEDAITIIQSYLSDIQLTQAIGSDNVARLTALFEGMLQGVKLLQSVEGK